MQKRAVEVVIGLQKHAADAGVVEEKLVAEAAGVGVTYGDNHNQHTVPYIIHQYTVHGTSYPPYAVTAFLWDKILKTKAQERYGNASGTYNFFINWKKGTPQNPEEPKQS
jgi:hypothetical protein